MLSHFWTTSVSFLVSRILGDGLGCNAGVRPNREEPRKSLRTPQQQEYRISRRIVGVCVRFSSHHHHHHNIHMPVSNGLYIFLLNRIVSVFSCSLSQFALVMVCGARGVQSKWAVNENFEAKIEISSRMKEVRWVWKLVWQKRKEKKINNTAVQAKLRWKVLLLVAAPQSSKEAQKSGKEKNKIEEKSRGASP